jgi:uncharacterized membrane protein
MEELLKRPHPALVHFPITLYPLSLVFLVLYWVNADLFFLQASYWTFMISTLTILPVALTGWHDLPNAKPATVSGQNLLSLHVLNGITITGISIVAAVFFLWQSPLTGITMHTLYSIIVFLLSGLVFAQGYLGGKMVYTHHLGIEETPH